MNTVLTPLLAMTAWFLGLSILVQVLQEMWKFVTSSKSRAFENALADFLGPFVIGRLRQDPLLAVRGPFQFRRVGIAGRILPLNAGDLVASLEKSAPEWQRILKRALDFEAALQTTGPAPASPAFLDMVKALQRQLDEAKILGKTDHRLAAESQAFGDAGRVHEFLDRWQLLPRDGGPESAPLLDSAKLLQAFRKEFLPQADTIARHYDQFLQNFNYQYRRRNLRQTFAFSMLVAIVLNLPFEQIYLRATTVTPEQAIALADNAQQLYMDAQALPQEAQQEQLRAVGKQALALAQSATSFACAPRDFGLTTDATIEREGRRARTAPAGAYECASAVGVDYFLDPAVVWARLRAPESQSPRFLFGCFLTAILVTFGAPFWNDLSSTLLRAARPSQGQQATAAPDRPIKTEVE